MQDNAGTTLSFIDGFNFIIGLTGRRPSNTLGFGIAGPPGLYNNFFCNNKSRIKTNPKLTN